MASPADSRKELSSVASLTERAVLSAGPAFIVLVLALLAVTAHAELPAEDAAAADPANLAAEASQPAGAVAEEEAAPRTVVQRTWFDAGDRMRARAEATHSVALRFGAHSLDGPARALLVDAAGDGSGEGELAARLAPDLPVAHLARAGESWRAGERVAAALGLGAAVMAIPRHFEAQLWLGSSTLLMLVLCLCVASVGFTIGAAISVARSAMHDLGDLASRSTPSFARFAFLAAMLLAPIAFGEGLLGLTLVCFALAFTYGGGRLRAALAVAVVLLLAALGPIATTAGRGLVALDADPVASAAGALLQERANEAELALLEANVSTDLLATHVLAVEARRAGDAELAKSRYEALLERDRLNHVARANLGTLFFEEGETERAIELYEAAASGISSPVLLFNLSQAYARAFRMEEFEIALRQAQLLDAELVASLSAHAAEVAEQDEASTNIVSDVPFPVADLRARLLDASIGEALPREILAPLAPGWLGANVMTIAIAFAVTALLALLIASRFDASTHCSRCGDRICTRCDSTFWSADTCEICHRFFSDPDSTDPTLRAARLARLRTRGTRIDRAASVAAFLVPGAGGFLAGRPGLALVGIACFVWSAFSLSTWGEFLAEPLALGVLAPLLFVASGLFAGFVYLLLSLLAVVLRRQQASI